MSRIRVHGILALQRHFRVLTKFAHVESQFFGHKRQREVVLYVGSIRSFWHFP
jgi:hypothetical protein